MRGAIVMAGLLLAAAARADEAPAAAARLRQARVKTLVAMVRQTSFLPAGGYSRARPVSSRGNPPLPAADLSFWAVNRLMLTGDAALWEDHVVPWHPTDPPRNRMVHIWDGAKGLTFLPDGLQRGSTGQVAVYQDDWRVLPHEMPLLVAFRPLDANLQPWVRFDRLKATGRTVAVEGEACVEYELPGPAGGSTRLLLSPRREHLPVLVEHVHKGKVGASTAISYQQYARGAWAPVRWVTERPGSDDGVTRRTGEVLSLRFNEPLAPSVLIPVFRPGATVHDYVKGAQRSYVVQPDGSWLLVEDGTAPPPAPLWRKVPAWGWGVVIAVVALAIAAAVLLDRLTPRPSAS